VKVREYKGIYVGKDPIPVDMNMIAKINDYETVDENQAKKYVLNNRHNSSTTIYYLILKKHLRKGGESIADITKYNPQDFKKEIV
jgi:5'-AMP-activated protein kinase catalytic alpha subunit